MVLWRPTRPFRTNTPKRCPFFYRGLETKSRKSRNTWSNRPIWPWNTEWSKAKANNRVLQENTLVIVNIVFQQTREDSTHGHHEMAETKIRWIIFFCSQRRRRLVHSAKTRPGADCGLDRELLIAKFRLKLKKMGENHWTRKTVLNYESYIE